MKSYVSPKRYVRSVIFNFVYFVHHLFFLPVLLLLCLFPRRAYVWGLEANMGSVAFYERMLLGLTYEIRGLENIPQNGTYIYASKHQSAWETYKLHLHIKDPAVIMKAELKKIPIWGWLAIKSDAIFVNRGGRNVALRSLLSGARKVKAQGRTIVIYPQGTRLAPTAWRPYKFGVIALYQSLDVPLVPVALNSGLFWPRKAFFKCGGHAVIEILPPIAPGLSGDAALAKLEAEMEHATARLVAEATGAPLASVEPKR